MGQPFLSRIAAALAVLFSSLPSVAQLPHFKVLVVLSKARDHSKMMTCAQPLLKKIAAAKNFEVVVTDDSSQISKTNLSKYKVFVQLQLAPFDMSVPQQDALREFIENGNGWVGIHAAGLTGRSFEKPTRRYWQWFEDFMGGVAYSPHPAFQKGTVVIEDRSHPVTRNLPEKFDISDEWYEFDKSPRPSVHVLGLADESTYHQNKPMGDHPIIWTNQQYSRMVYIGIGHDASMCADRNFEVLLRDAILWAASGQ
jgi:type 1 glutamine amidotransferase